MKMVKSIQGMNDVMPEDTFLTDQLERCCAMLFSQHAYHRIETPIMEKTELFSRSIGLETDIVSKEMYTFEDRNGDSLTLRPEGTASCVRAGIEHGLFYNQKQRFWYSGSMFRHERPQKGRYRQFRQIGVEAYGWETPDIDAEIISISNQIWTSLGLSGLELQINSLGSIQDRKKYRAALVDYLASFVSDLDDDSQKRLDKNPLRILDSKVESTQEILTNAPDLFDYLGDQSLADFEQLKSYLTALQIPFVVNTRLVRGLDYYNKTVFEWVYPQLGAQATVCAGGRYDGLVEQLGGKSTPAIGFAMGVERLLELVKQQQSINPAQAVDGYFISVDNNSRCLALVLANKLREKGFYIQVHCGDGSLKNQIKKADKSLAKYALILGDDEYQNSQLTIKPLRERQEQFTVNQSDLVDTFNTLIKR